MACQPLMAGPAVAVVTNSRSPEVLAAAAVEAAGLHVVEPPFPLDWTSNDDDYERAVRSALEADEVDAVLVIHAPAVASAIGGPIDHIDRATTGATKPVVAVMLGAVDGRLRRGSAVPTFAFPEPAVGATLGRLHSYWRWRTGEGAAVVESPPGIDVTGAARVIRAAIDAGHDQLSPEEVHSVLGRYGVAMAAAIGACAIRRSGRRGGRDRLPRRRQGAPPSTRPVGTSRRGSRSIWPGPTTSAAPWP